MIIREEVNNEGPMETQWSMRCDHRARSRISRPEYVSDDVCGGETLVGLPLNALGPRVFHDRRFAGSLVVSLNMQRIRGIHVGTQRWKKVELRKRENIHASSVLCLGLITWLTTKEVACALGFVLSLRK